jgi:hypothetical protein
MASFRLTRLVISNRENFPNSQYSHYVASGSMNAMEPEGTTARADIHGENETHARGGK